MKPFLTSLSVFIAGFLFVYAGFAFINWEAFPGAWSMDARFLMCMLGMICGGAPVMVLVENGLFKKGKS